MWKRIVFSMWELAYMQRTHPLNVCNETCEHWIYLPTSKSIYPRFRVKIDYREKNEMRWKNKSSSICRNFFNESFSLTWQATLQSEYTFYLIYCWQSLSQVTIMAWKKSLQHFTEHGKINEYNHDESFDKIQNSLKSRWNKKKTFWNHR